MFIFVYINQHTNQFICYPITNLTMENRFSALLLLLILSLTSFQLKCHSTSPEKLKTYIVYTGSSVIDEESLLSLHNNMLQEVTDSNAAPKSILHHYKRSFSGFAVKLTEEEADKMAGLDGVVSVFPNEKKQLHTTRSWDFIGFPQKVQRTNTESNVIIGLIDSGIWPESESFNDKGFGPPPSKWKGTCQGPNFTCNNKLIGGRYYRSVGDGPVSKGDFKSPRDSVGHGTHTASTAAGNPVSMASMLGLGQGTARGGAISARIAVYKACWDDGCDDADILAAFDDAIADGVDIVSVSLGGFNDHNYLNDAISIGSFHAMKNGVLAVFSGGNSGPGPATIDNLNPWSISVAAGTLDRKFVTRVALGDNRTYVGISINPFDLKGKLYPIIFGGDAPNTKKHLPKSLSRICYTNSLDPTLVKGKIVLCEGQNKGTGPSKAGAVGFLTQGQSFRDTPFSVSLPGSYLDLKDGASVYDYIISTRTPTATIFKSDELKDILAPEVASFSSRGPNLVTPEILKPDLIAPGVNILASWSPISPASGTNSDKRKLQFNIISGTSMSCPHVAGAAGYIKSFHPTWSPAAIRSALMTTAKQFSPTNNRDAEFAYGAGQINPSKAVNPGLVYDAGESDYIRFLCGQGFSSKTLQLITGDNSTCPEATYVSSARDLNYPSFALQATHSKHNVSGSFNRTVTNVGSSKSTYKAIVTAPEGLKIQVNPSVLSFTSVGQKQTFVVTIDGAIYESIVSASLVWDDGEYQVRSPIVVYDVPIP
ncbi:hypothetical protein RJT34_11621 [Clitoria ternatea]|uniref:Cucumisin n=1 Tax=Clitoria ternatea TaxID=43366 RepID=A0AAN9PJP7_CLITE